MTSFELSRRLERKGFTEEEIESALKRLEGEGYIDDCELARNLALSRMKGKNWGRFRIEAELRKRGVDDAAIEKALSELTEDLERASALSALRKRSRKTGRKDDFFKAFRRLKARGFRSSVINSVLKKVVTDEVD
jgi:regulatory protein